MSRRLYLAPLAILVVATAAKAQAPGADTSYPVQPQTGPWMILVQSYDGPQARPMAEDLIQEIRSQYKLPAYGFNRGAEERAKERERVRLMNEAKAKYLVDHNLPPDTRLPPTKTVRIPDQYAVLLGGFKDLDTARKGLDEVRKLKPPSDRLMHKAVSGEAASDGQKPKLQTQSVNPFLTAFVVRNPALPTEKATHDDKPDPNLKVYNADESYSLLKCPKNWTMVVKSYQGRSTIVQTQATEKSLVQKLTSSVSGGDVLNANAKQAHELATMLRKLGYTEVYVLHTEYSSYVTIGGYDAAGDPKLVQMQKLFAGQMADPKCGVGQLHTIGGVQFMAQPMPMMVPKF
ncbi:MAG: hypothetical protein U0746_05180 [Gemmataceae bacterium]